MHNDALIEDIRRELAVRDEIAFAYVHGSTLTTATPRDVDIAAYLREDVYATMVAAGAVAMDFAIPLEMDLEAQLGRQVDVQVLNNAPLTFRARVADSGVVVVDRDPDVRADFEYRSRYQYFDFRPRRQEYMAEVMA